MGGEVAESKTFEERMFDKIRSQMGDLMTEDELKAILEKAVDKAFFSQRTMRVDYRDVVKEPVFIELIRDEMKPLIHAELRVWLAENQETVGSILHAVIGESAKQMVANAFDNLMSDAFGSFAFSLRDRLMQNHNIQL